jgi:hypothetical protein
MTGRVRLEPKFGRRVRHPDGRLFDAGGEPVELTTYYRRLIADGDLVVATASKASPKKRTSR